MIQARSRQLSWARDQMAHSLSMVIAGTRLDLGRIADAVSWGRPAVGVGGVLAAGLVPVEE